MRPDKVEIPRSGLAMAMASCGKAAIDQSRVALPGTAAVRKEAEMPPSMRERPFVVGVGGSVMPGSSTEQALVLALRAAETAGAETLLIGGDLLCDLPHYGSRSLAETAAGA
jgi:hypothetical protein